MRIVRPAIFLAASAAGALVLPATASHAAAAASRHRDAVQVVASFDPAQGQNPENLAVAPDGTVYVTWLFAHSVAAIRPDGSQAVVTLPPGEASGIAIDPARPGRLTVALISADPGTAGIWTIPLGAFHGDGQQLTILDNRGICQHSGLCTDRLAMVFRADAEPFVAASGGRMDEIIRAVRDCPSGALSYAIDRSEAREQVDWGGTREPAIEVTKDGPHRISRLRSRDSRSDPYAIE